MAPGPPIWDIHDGSGACFRWCLAVLSLLERRMGAPVSLNPGLQWSRGAISGEVEIETYGEVDAYMSIVPLVLFASSYQDTLLLTSLTLPFTIRKTFIGLSIPLQHVFRQLR